MGLPAVLAAAGLAAAGLLGLQAEPSQAAARDGKCDPGEFCYFYNTDYKGSVSDFTASVADYGTTQPSCYEYKGAGDGKGRCIKNDAASAQNNTNQYVRVYYNSNYAGPYVELAPNTRANLTNLRSTPAGTNLKNNNASHRFMGTTPTPAPDPPQNGLHRPITGIDIGYADDSGLDIQAPVGTPVYAVADATINYAEYGHTSWTTPPDTPYSIGMTLDRPVTVNGVEYRYVFHTHLSRLAINKKDGSSTVVRVKKGQLLGYSGIGNKMPHLHISFYQSRSNLRYLSMEDTRRLFGSAYGKKWEAGK
ncbi:MAG: peptidase inhibitor family I36 protein [Micrococcales bacterium]|nr:peptidase inhibitor family I36 protein [Micrococcales bacterium]